MSAPELAAKAADAYLVMAKDDRCLADKAEASALYAPANIDESYGRNKVLAQIRLSRVRFAVGEPDQACDDGKPRHWRTRNTRPPRSWRRDCGSCTLIPSGTGTDHGCASCGWRRAGRVIAADSVAPVRGPGPRIRMSRYRYARRSRS